MTAPPLVDTHFHVWTRDLPLDGGAWHSPPTDADTPQLIETLDRHGVRFGVIAAASLYGTYNDYMRQALREHPHRLRATAIVDPDTDVYTLERMQGDGFVGVRLQWRYLPQLPDLGSTEWRRLLRRVRDLDWHVQLHDNSPRLGPVLEHLERAGVKIVVDHFGRPDPAKGIDCPGFRRLLASIEKGRTWVKLSAAFRMELPEQAPVYAAELLKVAGAERLFWGSDWPFASKEGEVTYEQTLRAFEQCVPDERLRARIGGETALRFFFGG